MKARIQSVFLRNALLAVGAVLTGACSDGYGSCQATRTCSPDSSAGASSVVGSNKGATWGMSGSSGALGAGGLAGGAKGSGGTPEETPEAGVRGNGGTDPGSRPDSDGGAPDAPDATDAQVQVPPPPPDPCLACDPHALCTPSVPAAPCKCIQGYSGDGQQCVRDLCQPLAGAAPPCGVNATCTGSSTAISCACTSGFLSCDGSSDAVKGCETKPANDPKNCGACGFACAGSLSCTNGLCGQVVTKLALNGFASYALLAPASGAAGGKIEGWGSNTVGGLTASDTSIVDLIPTPLAAVGVARDLAAGESHACVLSASADTVQCWGYDLYGQLGTSTPTAAGQVLSTAVPGVVELALGGNSTCARTGAGSVICWGNSSETGTGGSAGAPLAVPGITDARRLFGGSQGYCAIHADNTLSCWGISGGPWGASPTLMHNADGTLLKDAASMAIALTSYCIVRTNGTVACAGSNDLGQLGRGTIDSSAEDNPLGSVPGLSGVSDVSGHYDHYCARTSAGALYCWGRSEQGELGLGANVGVVPPGLSEHVVSSPTLVPGMSRVLEVVAGYNDTCVRLSTGQVRCFGDNTNATLGDGTQIQRTTPVNVVGLP